MSAPRLIFSASPHVHTSRSTQGAMFHVLIALLPAVACSLWYFRLPALGVLLVSVCSCMLIEWVVCRFLLHRKATLGDGSALLTGVLLALNLPASLPLWMAAAGAVMAVGVAKMAFGGLGCNIFNPALAGRVFLLISFPVAMTSFPVPFTDGITGPTLLTSIKLGNVDPAGIGLMPFVSRADGSSMGEASAIALLVGFAYLLFTKVIKWHIPLAVVAGLALTDVLAGYPVVPDIFSGGLLLGAIFMATDYVTSPVTSRGMLLYGFLIGVITAVIRRWGAYPEGVSFAILIMNGFTPLIDRYIRPRRFAPRRKEAAA